ncbi:MAG: hypothetical protein CHACPFDD_00460 [Phycisphaerae bacterium]|nr:hypothetical protein [Phycisphaerae bacterium]
MKLHATLIAASLSIFAPATCCPLDGLGGGLLDVGGSGGGCRTLDGDWRVTAGADGVETAEATVTFDDCQIAGIVDQDVPGAWGHGGLGEFTPVALTSRVSVDGNHVQIDYVVTDTTQVGGTSEQTHRWEGEIDPASPDAIPLTFSKTVKVTFMGQLLEHTVTGTITLVREP